MHLKKISVYLLTGQLFFAAFQAPSATTGASDKNLLDSFLEDLDTFSADFEQSLVGESGEILETTKGVVQLRRPGMFFWSYSEPYVQKIISDGITLWIYDEDLDQVTINDAAVSIEDTPASILSGDFILAERYVAIELESDDDVAWLELTPKDLEAQYRSLRLAFLDNDLKGMMLFDNLGQATLITFTNTSRNPQLDRELFRFSPQPDIDIIDAR